jgi:hydrogenase maturation protease
MIDGSAPRAVRRRIVCFGNPLHGDDGVGPAVAARLAAATLPADVEVAEGGIAGIDALPLFEDVEAVVIVDASRPQGRPGRVWHPTRAEVLEEVSPSGHGLGVGHLLRCLEASGAPPPTIGFVAIEAAAVTPFRLGLSEPVADAVAVAAARVLADLHRGAAAPRALGEVPHG